jgi:hypothetical protein
MTEQRKHDPDLAQSYPPSQAGLDPVTIPPRDPSFAEAVAPYPVDDNGNARLDPFYHTRQFTQSESFKRKDFSSGTWVMIVIAGIVFGASMALMASGA